MRIKNLLFTALATLVLVSCNDVNNQNGDGESVNGGKVTLKIVGNITRAEGSAVGATAPITFTSGHLYFVSATNRITKYMTVTNSNAATTSSNVDLQKMKISGGETIDNVPTNTTKVYLIGNVPSGVTMPVSGSFDDVEALTATMVSQGDATGGVTKVSLCGVGSVTETAPGSGQYKAAMDLKPISSRIEIVKFSQKAGSVIDGYKIDGIFVNHFYNKTSLVGVETGVATDFVNNLNDPDKYKDNVGVYATAAHTFLYDWNSTAGLGNLGAAPTFDYTPSTAGKVWAYNVLAPTDASAVAPHIVVRLSNITTTDASVYPSPQFLTIKGFNLGGTVLTALTPGKVYSLTNIAFNQSDLRDQPEVEDGDLDVEVTVIDWTTEVVSPEF